MSISTSIWDAAQTTLDLIKTYLGGDDMSDWSPIHDETVELGSEKVNKLVAGLAECGLRLRQGLLVQTSWSHPNVAASGTSVSLYRNSGNDTALTILDAPWDGTIVGLCVRCENARSAGTCTINIEVNGTPVTIEVVLDGTNSQVHYVTQLPAAADTAGDEFSAGDTIEVTYTTDGTWAAGSTPSVVVDLYLAIGD